MDEIHKPVADLEETVPNRELWPIFLRSFANEISPQVALMQMLAVAPIEDLDEAMRALSGYAVAASRRDAPIPSSSRDVRTRIEELVALFSANRERCIALARAFREQPDFYSEASSERDRIEHYRRMFDTLVRDSPEASVAAYSLGNPELLAQATSEIVTFLRDRGLVDRKSVILEIGCGIGRFEAALAPMVRRATGIDVSEGMIAEARLRCDGMSKVTLEQSAGVDLASFEDSSFDLIFAVDSFPYIVAVSDELVRVHFAEAARVLVSGGHFLILNFSYRDTPELDRADVARHAAANGLEVLTSGEKPFASWDGTVFLMRK